MTADKILQALRDKFGGRILKEHKRSDRKIYVDIYPKDIVEFTKYVFNDLSLRFNIASAVDTIDGFEILYHFSSDVSGVVLSIRTLLRERSDARIDTITGIMKAAWWIEREMHEMFGIYFNGNEDLRQLLLPDDWPKGVYPMRKDFIPPKRDSRKPVD